ncbi:major facilitator superfamily transporter [Fusarium mexicanum]|uniref:Major facilitator superfamily transporter n=1 Tax=Fusarium mexicanum TaxID=751941 RepID=A0A8H5MN11_9HYPO|nr:major facilitator superfamily transporter [Fusarium mexicanum]
MSESKNMTKNRDGPKATQLEWIADAQDANAQEHNLKFVNALKLYRKSVFWALVMSTAIFMEGYDTMLLGNMYGLPAFRKRYGHHIKGDNYQISAPWQAGLSNGSACGQLVGLLVSGYVSERFGFRKTMIWGLTASAAFIFIPFFAPSLAVLEVGQILFGVFMGLYQTIPVVYAVEISPVRLQAYLTTWVNTCWAIGHLIGAGILRGILVRGDEWGYRIPFAIQWIWPVILVPTLYFAPESPWWLVRKGRLEEAKKVLERLTSAEHVSFDIDKHISLMVVTTNYERAISAETSYLACFKGTDLKRTLIAVGVYCIQTLSGNSLRSYSTYFMEQAGFPTAQASNMTIINYSLALIGGLVSWLLLPFFGRRSIYVMSIFSMLLLMTLIGGVGIPQAHSSRLSYSWAIAALLIVSSFLYNATIGPLTNTICSEVPSTILCSRTLVLSRWFYTVTSITAGVLTPYQLNPTAWNWGAKTGFFWAGGCLISFIFAFFCVPETKDRTAAEVDILFDRKVSLRCFSKTPVDLVEAVTSKEERN